MPLLSLPPELIRMIAECLNRARDLYALDRTNRLLYCHTDPVLYKYAIQNKRNKYLSLLAVVL